MNNRIKLVIGVLLFALMLTNIIAGVWSNVWDYLNYSNRGWEALDRDGKAIVYKVDSDGPAASSLKVGDEVISLKGEPKDAFPLLYRDECQVKAGTGYSVVVRRDGQQQEFELKTASDGASDLLFDQTLLLVSLTFLLTGFAVFLLKPSDKQAWLLAIMLGALVGIFRSTTEGMPNWLEAASIIAGILGMFCMPLLFHFFLIFPERSPLLRRFPGLEVWLYVPFLTVWFWVALGALTDLFNIDWIVSWVPKWFWNLVSSVLTVMWIVYLAGGLVALILNYRVANTASRRKLRVVVFGCSAGFLNLLIIIVAQFLDINRKNPQLFDLMARCMLFTLPLIPLSFAYAIVRHRVIPVSLIIRRGIRYVLVSRGSILLEIIAVTAAVTTVLTYLFNRIRVPGIIIGLVSAVVGIIAWKVSNSLHEKYLAPVIDRKFFRQAYNTQSIIADLAQSLRSTASMPQLMQEVATKIQRALQTESVTILLRDDETGDYSSSYSCEYSPKDGRATECRRQFKLPQFADVIGRLADSGQPIEIDLNENGSAGWVQHNGSNNLSVAERETLRQMKTSLLLPLSAKDRMLGIISLGSRLGDLPYSREDKHLLMSLAGPTTFAVENSRLVEKMIDDARRHQELEAENEQRAKELEEARQLQLSMLPKEVPKLPHLEIAAYMKPATEVGGDYYDFHLAEDGTLTVAVGDATGHGLKAGTVVTATKSLFNHLAPLSDIVDIFHQSSRALKLMNLRGLYMAMTMVKLKGYHLAVSSAGMPSVLIYRKQTNIVEELMIQGMPLGSIINYPYRLVETHLSCGDILVLMSDGFPERFNAESEILDYDKAKEVLVEIAEYSPGRIIEHFVTVGENWADGRPQNDDVTFVVIKTR